MRPTEPAGSSPANPLYFRVIRDAQDNIDWKKVAVALALSALSGYLAVRAQRAASGPDQLKAAKMRLYLFLSRSARNHEAFWRKIADNADTRYDIARL